MRSLHLLGPAYFALGALAVARLSTGAGPAPSPPAAVTDSMPAGDAAAWFRFVRPHCNALEVETTIQRLPAPAGLEGAGHAAACWAIAGNVARARETIYTLPPDDRWRAAGIVFDIAHPIADMGDDRSAGPIMELVVELWPNHYQALYHAGAARFARGDGDLARKYLEAFLRHYDRADGWTASARAMLQDLVGRGSCQYDCVVHRASQPRAEVCLVPGREWEFAQQTTFDHFVSRPTGQSPVRLPSPCARYSRSIERGSLHGRRSS